MTRDLGTRPNAAAWIAPLGVLTPAIPWLIAVALLAFARPVAAAGVEILLSEDSGAYREMAELLRQEFSERIRVTLAANESTSGDRRGIEEPDLVIAVGTRALTVVLAATKTPVIATLVPRASFENAVRSAPRNARKTSALFIDQPFSRQLNLVKLVLPGRIRAGVIFSAELEESMKLLRTAALEEKFTVVAESIGSQQDLYAGLVRVLGESDFLLAVPDPNLYNAATIHNILLTTFRVKQPVFGFSPAYVRAGALAGLYSTPPQLASQTGEIARRVLAGGAMPSPQYPRQFTVGVNPTVTRALGLDVLDGRVLASKLAAMEQAR